MPYIGLSHRVRTQGRRYALQDELFISDIAQLLDTPSKSIGGKSQH